jgi:serine/threonine protein kinase
MTNHQLNQYKIIDQIGQGGFATVYLAEDINTGHQVALKVLRSLEARFTKRFEREARSLTKLNRHPHIVTIHDFGQVDDQLYIAMEYMAGGSLRDFMTNHPQTYLPTEQVLGFLEQLAVALDYAHSQNMIHRDIKPDNILLDEATNPQRVVLTDFGLVKYHTSNETLTATSIILGTRGYMAPEQFTGTSQKISPASDIYALSVVAYQLLTGELPPIISEPAHPQTLNPNLSPTIATALLRGLAKLPEERPSTAQSFVSMLKVGRKPEILVVEDDKNMRATIKHILRDKYTIALVEGPQEALTKLAQHPFDVVIVDLNMGGDEQAGFKLLADINEQFKRSRLLKIILTAKYDMPSVVAGYDYGVEAYIPKDQNMETNLLRKIERALQKRTL